MTGKLTFSELKQRARRGEIETVIAAFTDHYGRLLGKRFSTAFFLDDVVSHGTHACDYLLTTEKDAVKLPPGIDLGKPLFVLPVEIEFTEEAQQQRFNQLLLDRVRR